MLAVRDLRSRYGRIQALHGVSLDVARGEIVVVIGANGAGKTTLLRAISGVQPITAGTVVFEGLRLDTCAPHRVVSHGVAQVPEGRHIFGPLSVANNLRLRVRAFADNDDFPSVPSITALWASANWFEREAFDLFGIVFPGHNDLRRILTDYGFIGHPFRKDFPISGYVEMRYDPDQRRVIYQPVTIEPRENTPRIVREETYGDL